MSTDKCLYTQLVVLHQSVRDLRGPESIMLRSKHACLYSGRTLFLSFKAVCYTNILEKTIWNKGQSVPLLTWYSNMREAQGECFPNNIAMIITNIDFEITLKKGRCKF